MTGNASLRNASLSIAVLGLAALFAGARIATTRLEAPLERRQATSVGELLMKAGMRLEDAGKPADAREQYELALGARFEGPQNRRFVQRRLGALLLEAGEPAEAAPQLENAPEDPRATSEDRANLCRALLEAGDDTALLAALYAWEAHAKDGPERAVVLYWRGQRAAAQGEDPAPFYSEGDALVPGSPNTAALAESLRERSPQRAANLYARYLLHGGTGDAARNARRFLKENPANLAQPMPL